MGKGHDLAHAADPAAPHHEVLRPNGQQQDYVVLTPEERAKGLVKPLRHAYVHKHCGFSTRLGASIAETFARAPGVYSGTFCTHCSEHFPLYQFEWLDGEPMYPPLQAEWAAEQLRKGEEQLRCIQSMASEFGAAGEYVVIDPPHAAFKAWLTAEMPAGTVIADPGWWAPRILRAVERLVLPGSTDGQG